MTKDEALRKALGELEEILIWTLPPIAGYKLEKATATIKEVLAQPEQEPVAWANRVIGGRKWLSIHASKGASDKWLEYRIKEQAQGEEYEQVALYTTPPQRKPLTDEQPQRWAVFCGICRKEWSVPYQHPGKSVCKECEAAQGIKGDA